MKDEDIKMLAVFSAMTILYMSIVHRIFQKLGEDLGVGYFAVAITVSTVFVVVFGMHYEKK